MDENLPIPKEESLPLSISEIVSNETMQDVFNTILKVVTNNEQKQWICTISSKIWLLILENLNLLVRLKNN